MGSMLSFADVSGVWIFLLQGMNEAIGEILIEEQLHDGRIDTSFRSGQPQKQDRRGCLHV